MEASSQTPLRFEFGDELEQSVLMLINENLVSDRQPQPKIYGGNRPEVLLTS